MKEKIKIAIDVDDCICNTFEMDYACAFHMMKNNLPKMYDKQYYDVTKTFKMDNAEIFYLKEKEYIMKNTSMYPKVFAAEVINTLRKRGFEIIFVTARLDKYWNGNAGFYLRKWLKKFDIQYDKIYTAVSDKSEVCLKEKVEYLIEDRWENVQSLNNLGIKSILLKSSYNKTYNNKLNVFAESWLEVYTILAKIYGFDENEIISFE